MSETNACPECGVGVPHDAPRGLCPRCLMEAASTRTVDERQGGPPVVDRDELLGAIRELGLLPAGELDRLASTAPGDPEGVARGLVRAGKLTPYQAGALLQGKARGLVIGEYLVIENVGVGGMGVVFKARHRPSGRIVALKILPPSFARDGEAVRRFRREFQVASRQSHPNLVAAVEASEDRGVHYLTMEYVPYPNGPWRGPMTHPAPRPAGQWNVLKFRVERRQLQIFADGARVGDPIPFEWDLTPASILIGADSWSGTVRAEFDRIEVRAYP